MGEGEKNYCLQELIDVELLASLAKTFFEATGLSSAIMDTDGTIVVHAGWKPACANFYRKNPETRKLCVQSDAYMAKHVAHTDSYILYKCENGLIDAAVPIIVAGKHLASIYHGQLLFNPPDRAFFREQAGRYGFPEAAFMQAVDKIPIYSREKFDSVINYFITLAKLIAKSAEANLRLRETPAGKPQEGKGYSDLAPADISRQDCAPEFEGKPQLPLFSMIVDESGRILQFYAQPGQNGQNEWAEIFPDGKAAVLMTEIGRTLAAGGPLGLVKQVELRGGSYLLDMSLTPAGELGGGKRAVAVIARKKTQQDSLGRLLEFYDELKLRSEFVSEVAAGRLGDNEAARKQAAALGLDLAAGLYGIAIGCGETGPVLADSRPQKARRVKNGLLMSLLAAPEAVIWETKEGICLLCAAGLKAAAGKQQMLALVEEKLTKLGCLPAYVGVSEVHQGIDGLGKIARQSAKALAAAKYTGRSAAVNIVDYREAGIFQLITDDLQLVDSQDFIQGNIGPVIEYDRQNGTNFLQTLEELLTTASIKEIAEKLYLHPKTVIFRRQRIEKILGIDLEAVEARLALGVAIRLHKMQQRKKS